MNVKLIVASLLFAAAAPVFAADQHISVSTAPIIDGDNKFISVTAPGDGVLSGGEDVIFLDGLSPGKYDISITVSGQDIVIDGAKTNLNGVSGLATNIGKFAFLGIEAIGNTPFALHLFGTAAIGGIYSGNVQVAAAPIPEPETYAMLLAGMGLLGFIARRRKS